MANRHRSTKSPESASELTRLKMALQASAVNSTEFRSALDVAAVEIRAAAKDAATEKTVEGCFERVMYSRLEAAGIPFAPEKEIGVARRHTARGRLDSRVGGLVFEFKRPSLLATAEGRRRGVEQLSRYIEALSATEPAAFVGILTNGRIGIEIHAKSGEITSVGPMENIDGVFLLRIARHVQSLSLTALTPTNLVRDFCGSEEHGVLFSAARVLERTLAANENPKTRMLRSEWERLFRLSHDDSSNQRAIEERRRSLSMTFKQPIANAADEYRCLFALHTAYAVLLKLIAYRIVSDLYLGLVEQGFKDLMGGDDESLRIFCSALEDGALFRKLGILNLLEGDFFSWYADSNQWNSTVRESVEQILVVLARYEDAEAVFRSREAIDLFRDLYQAAVPRPVRSSFGEVYTPSWLADYVIEAARQGGEWRLLDPCCGSGTFLVQAISKLRQESRAKDEELLKDILSSVAGIDLHPLAVLTARVNYFIHVGDLITPAHGQFVLPIYLGDASSVPSRLLLDGKECLSYELSTLKKPITCVLPAELVGETARFMDAMRVYESLVLSMDAGAATSFLASQLSPSTRTPGVLKSIRELSTRLVELEQMGWNGIWARILSNYLSTACLGKFDIIAGNPPWIDWKNLPAGYREKIKGLCVERHLFSGAGKTGGINLNVCALITYVSLSNWLAESGRLAFLMPRELLYQASYEGWRHLGNEGWRFWKFDDWTRSGHPFDPIREDFMTFVIARRDREPDTVSMSEYVAPRGATSSSWPNSDVARESLIERRIVAGRIIPSHSAYTIANTKPELESMRRVAGQCSYIGRDGIQFYPQELQLFRFLSLGPRPGTVWVENVQVQKARHRVPRKKTLLEHKYLFPLAKSTELGAFTHEYSGLIVAFPHSAGDPRRAIDRAVLQEESPLLLNYYKQQRSTFEKLSHGNDRVRDTDKGEFYSLARVGHYSFAPVHVAFRKDTKWCATVIASGAMPWGESKKFVFQSHAVSICERIDGGLVSEMEAHFVCAVLNAPTVERFVLSTSDNRSYKVRPPVRIPLFDADNELHAELSNLSQQVHMDRSLYHDVRLRIDDLYLRLCTE